MPDYDPWSHRLCLVQWDLCLAWAPGGHDERLCPGRSLRSLFYLLRPISPQSPDHHRGVRCDRGIGRSEPPSQPQEPPEPPGPVLQLPTSDVVEGTPQNFSLGVSEGEAC